MTRRVSHPAAASLERLREVPMFGGLEDDSLKRIAAMTTEFAAPAGQTLVAARREASGLFIVEEGEVVVQVRGKVVSELGPGQFFGELALLTDVPRTATVRAKTDVKCIAINRADFLAMLESEPKISLSILKDLAARIAKGSLASK